MYLNFYKKWVNIDQSKTMHTHLFAKKIVSCINLQLPIVILKENNISDMHHCVTYMYINFQQNRASRSVKTEHTN